MTYFMISKKMLRANFRRFYLYFLCSFFALTLFFCFAALFTDNSFMGGATVDSLISSNVIFPSILAAAFLLLFVPYSYSVFLSARKREYGILFSLGMSRLESWKCLLAESLALGAIALGASFLAGTAASFTFYGILAYALGIPLPGWGIPYQAYAVTALLYGIVLAITAALQGIQLLSRRIGSLLLSPFQAEKKGRGYQWLKQHFPGYATKRLLEWSLLARHKKDWAIRYLFSALLSSAALYLAGFCTVILPSLLYDAQQSCPYDLAYSVLYGQNQVPADACRSILAQHGVTITEEMVIPYARDAAFNYLPVSEVNGKLGGSYQIPAGTFLELFQENPQNGYGHSFTTIPQVSISLDPVAKNPHKTQGTEERHMLELNSCGSDIRVLFNKNPTLADRTLVLNDADFRKIASISPYWQNEMRLLRFQDWESSADGVEAFQSLLQAANGLTKEGQRPLRASSKAEDLQKARQSCQFGIFLMGFVELLLLMAAFLLIHFRIAAEQEENRRALQSLFMVGMADSEQFRLFLFKNRMRFLPPILGALFLSLPFLYQTGESVYHSGRKMCMAGILAALLFLFALWGFTIPYTRKEWLATKYGR